MYTCLDYEKADKYGRFSQEIVDHVGNNYTNGADDWHAIFNIEENIFTLPENLLADISAAMRHK